MARVAEAKTKSKIISYSFRDVNQLTLNCKNFSYFRLFTNDIVT